MILRRVWLTLGCATIAIVVVGASLFAWHQGKTASSDSQQHSVRVHVIAPQTGGPERMLTRPGTIHAFQYAELYAKVTGYLRNQVVDIGDIVKKDQALAEIYAPEIRANVDKAVADLTKAKAQVEVMKARRAGAEADLKQYGVKVEQTQADLETSVAMLQLRKVQYKRFKDLADSKAIEQELVDEKFAAWKAAEANERAMRMAIESARSAVVSAKARVVGAEADLDDAKAQVDVAKASLARAQVFQDYTTIRAPFDGVITRRTYHEGDFIREGSSNGNRPILAIAVRDLMRVVVDVPAPDVPYTHTNVRAEIRLDTLPGKVFPGKVARTAASEDYNSRTMRTEVDLHNPDNLLTDGMFCSVTLYLGSNSVALRIPSACLFGKEQDGERFVYVVRKGKAHKAPVHVGLEDGILAEVLSGLAASDQVIAGHGPGLADGVTVAVETTKKD
jgi:RND family efflux transporter MFP subunit